MRILVSVIHVIVSLVMIASILMQSSKAAGLSGAIGGGAETFFGKNKGRTMDALFAKITEVSAAIFIVTSVLLSLLIK
ncbi:preprotein translocase subunit SecG [Caldanaerobius fijiensis DSM 17918]|uniref:Protein-export membrane protein SecG n=1 Tax=Caldanaerobius fijiensis DSM 17918 TaxID=1121256 RepID=A0A1M5CST7_9THEO|nr:preprotein translocase subunit SecG [Caldanaerobius fijiensis]SHF57791.1 preprotein translocase subunit SecG [Caldanaerobius fijiensis DSM 17918]